MTELEIDHPRAQERGHYDEAPQQTETAPFLLALGLRDWADVERLVRALPAGNDHKIQIVGSFRTLVDLYEAAREFEVDAVLLDPALPGFSKDGLGLEAIRLLWHNERKPVVTIGAVPEASHLMDAMKSHGVKDFTTTPLGEMQISRLVTLIPRLINEAHMERASSSYIPPLTPQPVQLIEHGGWQRMTIAIWSPKGGVGKTFLAVNLACALGVLANRPTVLVDADMNEGNVHIHLRLGSRVERQGDNIFGLANLYAAEKRLTSSTLKSKLITYRGKLEVLAGLPVMTLGGDEVLTGDRGRAFMNDLLDALAGLFDFRVIDLGQSYHHPVHLATLERSDLNLVVVNSEAASIHDVAKSLPPLRDILEIDPARFKLVFNKFDDIHGIRRKDVVQLLGLPQFGFIPADGKEEVTISINQGEPLVLYSPKSPVARAIVEVASSFYSPLMETSANARGLRSRSRPGLIRRVAGSLLRLAGAR